MRPHSSGPGQGGPGLACPAEPSFPGAPQASPQLAGDLCLQLLALVLCSPVTPDSPLGCPLPLPLSYQEHPSEDHAAPVAGGLPCLQPEPPGADHLLCHPDTTPDPWRLHSLGKGDGNRSFPRRGSEP